MKIRTHLILAVLFTLSAIARAADAPNLSSPKEAAKAFETALQKGDAEAAKRCVLDQPGHREVVAAMAKLSLIVVRIEAASQKQFGTSLESDGNPHVTLRIPDPNGANYATTTGDDHYATVSWPGRKDDPIRVARVGNEWRVDMTDEKRRNEDELKNVAAQLEKVQKVLEDVQKDIEAGKFANVVDARYAFLNGMIKTGIAQVNVEVKSVSETSKSKK